MVLFYTVKRWLWLALKKAIGLELNKRWIATLAWEGEVVEGREDSKDWPVMKANSTGDEMVFTENEVEKV